METHQTLSKEANPRAISIRIKARSGGQATGQRRHDLRMGRQPGYVDATRQHLNDIIISPLPTPELRQICIDRRSQRETKRSFKSNASIATCGIITLGIEAQVKFAALDHPVQIAAMTAVAEAIAQRLKTTLTGLVIHRDETAIHGHFQMPSVNLDGHPITQANSLSDISRLQDLAADTIGRFEPSIERGNRKRDRLAAGATWAEVTNRAVRELHWDLPIELARKQKRVADMGMRVSDLEAKIERTEAENKRLQIYKKRYEDRIAELALAEREMQATVEAMMAEEKKKILKDANEEAEKIRLSAQNDADAMMKSFDLVMEEKVEPTMTDDRRTWRAKGKLDEGAAARFKLGLGMFRPLFDRLHAIMFTLSNRIERLRTLVRDLEVVREEMDERQRQKLDQAKTELDDPSPF